ncbi:MAG: histidine phosphatase family protein [Spirochaetaceae bacterium]|jgi:alpha-ribazole phosphatase|nr:histidine phosphatase family protein [Spirochaetaceae bacterium]
MDLFFVRHARTSANSAQMIAGGQSDIPISPEGEAAARELAASDKFAAFCRRFPGGYPRRIRVSPMIRAQQTAGILFPRSEQVMVEGLREMCFGIFEGRLQRDLDGDPEFEAWKHSDDDTKMPGGESINGCCDRITATLAELVRAADPSEPLVVVSHGGVAMSIYYRYIEPDQPFFHHYLPNCGIRHFDCRTKDGMFSLAYVDSPLEKIDTFTEFLNKAS